MADLVPTVADVLRVSGSTKMVQLGEAATQGKVLYKNTSDGKYYNASNAATGTAKFDGIALSDGATDQWIAIQTTGEIDIGTTVVVGEMYVLSATGAIAPVGDAIATDWMVFVGYGKTTTNIFLNPIVTGLQHG